MTPLPRLARAAVVLTSLAAIVLGAVGPAEAGSWSRPDPRGDGSGSTYSPEPPPCGTFATTPGVDPTVDVTRLRVQHRGQAVRVRVSFADLGRDPRQLTTVHLLTPDGDTDVEVALVRGRARATWLPGAQAEVEQALESADECGGYYTSAYDQRCRGLWATVSAAADRVEVTVPRRCLGGPRWVRGGVTASTDVGGRYDTDEWARAGVTRLGAATYGAKVRAPRA